ncbi:MAG: hypothetical protein ACTSUE_18075 [Promethearchaeota archaeon]
MSFTCDSTVMPCSRCVLHIMGKMEGSNMPATRERPCLVSRCQGVKVSR